MEGKLQTRKWQTKEGQDRYTTEIIVNEMTMLGEKSSGKFAPAPEKKATPVDKSKVDTFDDDIPF